jgi:hypothetical protein
MKVAPAPVAISNPALVNKYQLKNEEGNYEVVYLIQRPNNTYFAYSQDGKGYVLGGLKSNPEELKVEIAEMITKGELKKIGGGRRSRKRRATRRAKKRTRRSKS